MVDKANTAKKFSITATLPKNISYKNGYTYNI